MRVFVLYDVVPPEYPVYFLIHPQAVFFLQNQVVRPRRGFPQQVLPFDFYPLPVAVHFYPEQRLKPCMPVASRGCLQFLQFCEKDADAFFFSFCCFLLLSRLPAA